MASPQPSGAMAVVDRMYKCFAQGDMATLKSDVFHPQIVWNMPGHHPLAGAKRGPDEVIQFFSALLKSGVTVDNVSFGTIGDDRVVETHYGHGETEGEKYDFPTCTVYRMQDGKLKDVQVYTAVQHDVDRFFFKTQPMDALSHGGDTDAQKIAAELKDLVSLLAKWHPSGQA